MDPKMKPTLILQQKNRERLTFVRDGLGGCKQIVPLGIDDQAFWKLAGLDALYVSLSMAERWGSRPIPPHTAMVLKTTDNDRAEGLPPFIVTGMLLDNGEQDTGRFSVPLVIAAIVREVLLFSKSNDVKIETVGIFERIFSYSDIEPWELGVLIRNGYEDGLRQVGS
jgi:hypothetical protein